MLKLLRVDHRLLHGQVAFSWTKQLGADCILIANDEVVQDELRMTAIRMSKPNGVKLVMKSVEDSIKASISDIGRDAPRRVMARYFTPTWGKVNFPTDSIRVP